MEQLQQLFYDNIDCTPVNSMSKTDKRKAIECSELEIVAPFFYPATNNAQWKQEEEKNK